MACSCVRFLALCLGLGLLLSACEGDVSETVGQAQGMSLKVGKADELELSWLPADFPSEQDLAILVPMDVYPPLRADLATRDGGALLSATWLEQVSEAYEDTDVMDALEVENWYEEWQVVSVRIAPCGPLGHHPGHLDAGVCWPQVRVVWQPVIEDFFAIHGVFVDRYADDRAVHALYRVHPSTEGAGQPEILTRVLEHVASGASFDQLGQEDIVEFVKQRDLAIQRLVADVADLREPVPGWADREVIDVRVEYWSDAADAEQFHANLYDFLWSYAQPWALHELTSFSLPEGRSPASIDIWVFVAFDAHDGVISPKDITVRSRFDGRELVNLGRSQTVSGEGEDEPILKALEDPDVADELAAHVFLENSDAEVFGDVIADPTQTFVSNTTCATCHRLTELSFDFHTFSFFEDRSATVSPRVISDVANDLEVLRSYLAAPIP